MVKAYHIDATNQVVVAVEYETLEDMRRFVGGHITIASVDHSTGDVLYVDDEGMLKEQQGFFIFAKRLDQLLHGNGLYVGREIDTESGWTTLPPALSIEQVGNMVIFLKPE